ncbi:MAG: NADH-quinone oxidoreductase subunit NuoF [Proteobacteria bacterium]|nr:NADH-quinone oxidoreductase subunit NuoF [Pseudomonadota bacterium]
MGNTSDKIKIITKYEGMPNSRSLDTYLSKGGYEGLKKSFSMQPAQIIEEVKASGLRGRGGAGFPTGLKWSFVPQNIQGPKYLICNNDEGEPGTFKDRYIAELSPHMIVEGMIIAAKAIGACKGYIYTRYEFFEEIKWLEAAIQEAYKAGFLGKNILGSGFDFDLDHYTGAGAYICGEETGLISSLEGKKGQPKLKPPFPAVSGYLGRPTVVNNTETFAAVPWIMINGAAAHKAIGTEKSAGTKLFSISGAIKRPGVYELPLGYSFERFLNDDCGGMIEGRSLKACIPGGASAPILTPEELKGLTMDYEAIAAKGSMLGSGAVMIIDDRMSMVELMKVIADFYHHESCGQCTPCREGTGWLANIMGGIYHKEGQKGDVDKLWTVAKAMEGRTICALSDAAAMPTKAITKKFGDELRAFIERGAGA